jgi:hypothetical protein
MSEMTFEEAIKIINHKGSTISGLMRIRDLWASYCKGQLNDYEDDHEFYSVWQYELNAFNIVYARFQPLFAGE